MTRLDRWMSQQPTWLLLAIVLAATPVLYVADWLDHHPQPRHRETTMSRHVFDPTELDDPDDLFPWEWSPWVTSEGGRREIGSISSPNGRRSDGTMHTYWSITGEVWEPHGQLICEAVNAWVKRGWRARLGRWLLAGAR